MPRLFPTFVLTALLSTALPLASAQTTTAQTTPSPPTATQTAPADAVWSAAALARARYVILPPRIEGNASIINDEQRARFLVEMRRTSELALKRRYPNATVLPDAQAPEAQAPDVVRVTPVVVAPTSLTPWAKLSASLQFELGGGGRAEVKNEFGLLTLWQHQDHFMEYLYGEVAARLP